MKARATVLMPVYNVAPYLKESIDSILNQTFPEFILLLIDDGSTDDSEKVIMEYNDPRIKYVKNDHNIGLVRTLNRGIDLIETEYIIRMDGDDISEPDRFKQLISEMDQNQGIGVLSSYLRLFGDRNEVWKMPLKNNEIKAGLIFNSTVAHAPCIMRTEVLKKSGIYYSEEVPHMEDWDLWYRLRNITDFMGIPKILYRYRILGHNVTVVNRDTMMERRKIFYRRMFKDLQWPITEAETEIHAELGKNAGRIESSDKLKAYKAWCNKLIELNHKARAFPIDEFKLLILERQNNLFFRAADTSVFRAVQYWFVYKKVRASHFRYILAGFFKKKPVTGS